MTATILTIADAVADTLNDAADLPERLIAQRAYRPDIELKALTTLHATVVPAATSMTAISRRDHDFDYQISVALRKRATTDDELDHLMLVAEGVVDLFRGKRLATFEPARCVEAIHAPIYDPESLNEEGVFFTVLQLTFRVARAITA